MNKPLPDPLLQTRGLCKRFGDFEAVRAVDLHVYPGDIYVLLGPNGAGKTTTLSMLAGLLHPSAGEITFTGQPGEMAGFIGAPPIYAHLSAYDNLALSYHMRRRPVARQRIHEILEQVGLAAARNRKTGAFSTGMRQRLGLARALLFDPKLVVLDEPTSGLDPDGIVEVREMILRLNRERQLTWLISSHLLAEAEQFATRVGILMQGQRRIEATLASLQDGHNVFLLETPAPEQARAALPAGAHLLESAGEQLQIQLDDTLPSAELNRCLVTQGVPVAGLSRVVNRLETTYFQICYGATGESHA